MNEISQALNLDITRRSNIQVIHLVQNDVASRKLVVKLTKDGVVQTITGTDLSAIINITRPDAQHASFSCEPFASSTSFNTIEVTIPTWAMEVAGQGLANFSILEGSTQKLSCENLVLDIQRSNNSSGDISQDDDTDILLELIGEVNDAVDRVNSIIETEGAYALEAEGHAKGTQDGVPVGSSSPYYHNNSKYWAEQAAESAASVDVHADGNYPEMTVGTAEALIGDLISEDDATYLMRPTPVDAKRKSVKVTGATVAFNQLVQNGNFDGTTGWGHSHCSASASNNVVTLTTTSDIASGNLLQFFRYTTTVSTHKHFVSLDVNSSVSAKIYARLGDLNSPNKTVSANVWTNISGIKSIATGGNTEVNIYSSDTNLVTGSTIQAKNFVIIDLTLMFGSTIADAIYAMEQAQAGSGVAFLKSHGFFTKPYYDYDAGSLKSVNVTKHKVVGFNQWDEEWEVGSYSSTGQKVATQGGRIRSVNMVPVLPNTTYYMSGGVYILCQYDASGNFISFTQLGSDASSNTGHTITTSAGTYFITFATYQQYGTTYNHDICINKSKTTGSPKNGDYAPHESHSYALNAATTQNPSGDLRGLFKIVNGELVADGDEYTSDGKVARKYGIVDLGTLTWGTSAGAFVATVSDHKDGTGGTIANAIVAKYGEVKYLGGFGVLADKEAAFKTGTTTFGIADSAYSDAATFKAAMSGVYLVYELATPTEEQATPYADPMISLADGTEEWDSPIPVYTETYYFDAVTSEDIKQAQSEMMAELKEQIYNTLPTDTITNTPIASFPDGADNVPVKSATFAITPVQDLHGYDSPWPAGGGKNLFDKSAVTSGAYIGADGTITPTQGWCVSDYIAVSNGDYVASGYSLRGSDVYLAVYDADKNYVRSVAMPTGAGNSTNVTIATGESYVRMSVRTSQNEQDTAQLEKGSTATAYAPYSNICPITGFTGTEITAKGVNLWDEEYDDIPTAAAPQYEAIYVGDGIYTLSTTAPLNTGGNANLFLLSGNVSSGANSGTNGVSIGNSKTVTATGGYVTIAYRKYLGVDPREYNTQLEAGSTATTYEPSVGTTHDISWSDEAGTVYGGTLQYLGGDAWRLTATNSRDVYDGTESWTASGNNQGFYHQNDTVKRLRDYTGSILCDRLKTYPRNGSGSYAIASFGITGYDDDSYPNQNWIYAKAEGATSAAEFKAWLAANPITVVYPLATPVTYDLTGEELATVLGNNNVFSNTGDVTELVYRADTGLFVEKKLGA